MPTMISARRVTKHYADESGEHAVLRGVDLDVATGEWVAVTGRSGSGKSTLLHLLGGLDTPTSGSVEVAGLNVSSARRSARARFRRRHIGFVFQQYNLIDDLSAIGNVELALALSGVPARRRRAVAADALDRLGLGDRADASPSRLSGGEQQRVALARAVAARPDVVLADEPTGALDVVSAALVIDTLRQLAVDGRTIVMATHDQHVAAAADRVVYVRDGVV